MATITTITDQEYHYEVQEEIFDRIKTIQETQRDIETEIRDTQYSLDMVATVLIFGMVILTTVVSVIFMKSIKKLKKDIELLNNKITKESSPKKENSNLTEEEKEIINLIREDETKAKFVRKILK